MNQPETARGIADRLREHLAPELYEYLAVEGTLPPGVLRDEHRHLNATLAAIASYIPSTIVHAQLVAPTPGQISGAYWDGTVLFADLSGFTALSERLSSLGKQGAEETSAIINRLFDALVDEVHRYHGGLLKFGGDALTAFFDAAALGQLHAPLAGCAALAMQARMDEFAELATRAGGFSLRLRIGVHSGRVFAAQVGNLEHIELVVTGRNINHVALAQEIAEPGEVVVSDSTLGLLAEATTEPRRSGFHRLVWLPAIAAPPRPPRLAWPGGVDRSIIADPSPADLLLLAERIDALRPYLPRNLPRRFLGAGGEGEIGEFRPVSVLFANFQPFVAVLDLLGEHAQAVETAARVLNAFYRRAQDVIHRYGGIVNKVDMYTSGDKLMALFGAPTAHEDDPVRAVRAALDLHQALDEANADIAGLLSNQGTEIEHRSAQPQATAARLQLRQRIGINTGIVFAGKVGSAERYEYTVMGQPVNLAARLMSAADLDAILVSPATRRTVERAFVLHDLPPARLKGIAAPVPLARVLGPRETPSPEDTIDRGVFVGREPEFARLLAEARAALNGSGRVVVVTGEAGSGKTRLIDEALQRLLDQAERPDAHLPAFFPYIVECQSYEQSTPYAAVRDLLRQLFGLITSAERSSTETISHRVAELTPELSRFTPLLADLLGVPFDDTPLTTALTPEQRHDRAQELIEAIVLAESHRQPLVLIVDDLHWADASSLELLARLARRAPRAPLLIVLGYRPDPAIAEPWRNLAHCSRLAIGELTAEASATLLRSLLRGEPPAALGSLAEKAQGNPFFIEEVVRSLIESNALRHEPDGWRLARPLDEASIPDSIEGVITARLDRLEERNREVIQIAAVVGRRFPYPILSGVVPRSDDLPERLQRLTGADLIHPDEIDRDLAYLFRHALTRDVAYESILYARRRELHRRVARQIEQHTPDRLDEQLALLARHYLLAEEWAAAFDYHLRAGRQAQARFANREAIALLERAIEIASGSGARSQEPGARRGDPGDCPESRGEPRDRPDRWGSGSQEVGGRAGVTFPPASLVEIHERLGVIYALVGEYDRALAHYEEARRLLGQQAGPPVDSLVRLHHHIARVFEKRSDFEAAFKWVDQALTLAGSAQNIEVARCLLLGAGLHQRQGRYQQAIAWGERALSLAEAIGSQREQAHALKLLGGTHRNLGDNLQAFDLLGRSLALYEQVQDLDGVSYAHNDLANICYELGRLAEARTHYEAGAEIKQAIGDVYGQALIANNLGNTLRLLDQVDAAIAQYQRSLTIFEQLGSRYAGGVLHMNLGATEVMRGDLVRAEEHLGRSAELFHQAGAEDFLPELERCLAELHVRRGNLAEARLACELSLTHATTLAARAEEGMTRRVLGQIAVSGGDLAGAWEELAHSLAILREVVSSLEVARTLLAIADLAPAVGRRDEGQSALAEALPLLREAGAIRDLAEARTIAARHGYATE